MSPFRAIFAALLLLGWLCGSNLCALAAAFPGEVTDCCESERQEPPTPTAPCQSACAQCATFENGAGPWQFPGSAIPAPVFWENPWLSALLLNPAVRPAEIIPRRIGSEHPPSVPLWHLDARTALPVRGPSCLV